MPITVQCDSCFQSYKVRDDKAGTVIRCKDCGGRIKVPDAGEELFDTDDFAEEEAPRRAAKPARKGGKGKKQSSSNNAALIGGAVAGVVVVLGIGIFLLARGGGAAPQAGQPDVAAAQPAAAPAAANANPAAPNPASPAPTGPEVAKTSSPPPGTPSNLGANPQNPAVAQNPAGAQAPAAAAPVLAPKPAAPANNPVGWNVAVDPPATKLEWPEKLELSIPIPGRGDEILYPTGHSPFVAIGFDFYESAGAQMWNLATGKKVGEIQGQPSKKFMRTVSPDGKYLAIRVLDSNPVVTNKVELWSFETGKMASTFDCDEPKIQLSILDFAGPDQFFSYTSGQGQGGKFWHRLKIWNIPTGTVVQQMEIDGGSINQYIYTFSPGRKYFTTILNNGTIFAYDVQAGKVAGKMTLPQASDIEPNLNPEAMMYSPDGSKLIVLSDGTKETRIMTVDVKTGKRDAEQDLTFAGRVLSAIYGSASYKGPKMACLPGDSGYLLAGSVFVDAASGRVVWYLKSAVGVYNHAQRLPISSGLIITEGPDNAKRFGVIEIPWDKIRASLKAIKDEKGGVIRPGMSVALDIQVGKLQHGKPEETKASLAEVLTERLAAEGIEVKEGEPSVLQVLYQEAAGNTLAESTRALGQRPDQATPTGRTVQATQANLKISWRDKGKKAIWATEIPVNPSFLIMRGEATAENARESMFGMVKMSLFAQPIPYFVPEDKTDKSLVQLPGFSELTNASNSAASRTKMRLDAAKKKKKG